MNKWILLFMISFVSTTGWAKTEAISPFKLNVYLPGIDFRFEDNMDQTQSLKTGLFYSLSTQIQNDFYVGVNYFTQSESSGNNSLSIERKSQDVQLALGYQIYQYQFPSQVQLRFFAMAYAGFQQTQVTTQLLSQSQTESTDHKNVMGLGGLVQASYRSLLLEVDTSYLTSENYNPNSISVSHIKLGYQIQF